MGLAIVCNDMLGLCKHLEGPKGLSGPYFHVFVCFSSVLLFVVDCLLFVVFVCFSCYVLLCFVCDLFCFVFVCNL